MDGEIGPDYGWFKRRIRKHEIIIFYKRGITFLNPYKNEKQDVKKMCFDEEEEIWQLEIMIGNLEDEIGKLKRENRNLKKRIEELLKT